MLFPDQIDGMRLPIFFNTFIIVAITPQIVSSMDGSPSENKDFQGALYHYYKRIRSGLFPISIVDKKYLFITFRL
ncbi:MAG: hypothetical protein ABI045_03115 [Flavobacteriales bacterium]